METNFRIAENSDTEILVELIREFHECEHLPFDDNSVRTMLAEIFNDDSLG